MDKMPPMNARRIASFVAMQAVPETYNRCTTIRICAQIVRVFIWFAACGAWANIVQKQDSAVVRVTAHRVTGLERAIGKWFK